MKPLTDHISDFWTSLSTPLFALAPMEDVTDTSFRELVLQTAGSNRLHLLFTEFTSVDGLCHAQGREAVAHRLLVNKSERVLLRSKGVKLIAQIWGNDPAKFYEATKLISTEYDFDGIDVNMGCPVSKVMKQNTCSALIDQPVLALEIISATIEGSTVPVSVKTRTGIRRHDTERWISQLAASGVSAITLHARTQKMMSLVPAEWDQISLAVNVRNQVKPSVKLLGNGDVLTYQQGLQRIAETGADGVMIGRGIFMDPWFFETNPHQHTVTEKIDLLEQHIRLYTNTWGPRRNYNILKHFFKIYVNGFAGAAAFRAALMETTDAGSAFEVIHQFRLLAADNRQPEV